MVFLLASKQTDYNGKTPSLKQEDKCNDIASGKSPITRNPLVKEYLIF